MIIIRQKIFSPQDYAGVKTYKQAKNIKRNRDFLAGLESWGQKRNKKWLDKQQRKIASLGLNEKESATVNKNVLETYNEKNNRMQRRMKKRFNVATSLATPGATITGQNSGGSYSKITTKDTPTYTYRKNNSKPKINSVQNQATVSTNTNNINPQAITQPQQKQGLGLGGKIAIGAGIAGAGYGAYRLIKARKQRKQASKYNNEEEEQLND